MVQTEDYGVLTQLNTEMLPNALQKPKEYNDTESKKLNPPTPDTF